MKKLLTVQDISCVGQCSITVALPIISAMGMETAILPSAVLSTHTSGFKGFTFKDLTDEMPKIISHWKKEGINFDSVYTGYIGNSKQFNYILEIARDMLKSDGLFIVDPVMGDNGKLYPGFDLSFPPEMLKICRKADYIMPNITEAAFLLNERYKEEYDEEYILIMLRKLNELGAKNVVITGVSFEKSKLGVAYYCGDTQKVGFYFRDRIMQNFHGTGDVFGSSLAGALALGYSLDKACKIAVDFTIDSMNYTMPVKDEHWYGVAFEKAIPNLVGYLK